MIEAAAVRQSAYVRNFQTGKYAEDATRILNEIAEARLVLLDPQKRAAYDRQLQNKNLTLADEQADAKPGAAASLTPGVIKRPPAGGMGSGISKGPAAAPASPTPGVVKGGVTGGMGSGVGVVPPAGATAPIAPAGTIPARPAPGATVPAHLLPTQPVAAPVGRAMPVGGAMPMRPPIAPVVEDPLAAIERAVPPPTVVLPSRRQSNNVMVMALVGGLTVLLVIGGIVGLSLLNRGGSPSDAVATTQGAGATASSPTGTATASSTSSGTYTPPGEDELTVDDPLNDAGSSRTAASSGAGSASSASSAATSGTASSGSAPAGSGTNSTDPSSGTFEGGSATQQDMNGQPSGSGNRTPASGTAAEPTVTSELPIDWSASRMSVPVKRDSIVVYAGGNSPFVFVDNAVYNMATGELAYRIELPKDAMVTLNRRASLAADGSMLIFAAAPFGETAEIYDCRTGLYYERVLPPKLAARVMYLAFRQPTEVVVCWQSAPSKAQVWNLKTKKMLREMNCDQFDGARADFSPDGQHMAVPVPGGVVIYNIWSKKLAARAAVRGSNSVPDGVRFSHDGQELAVVTDNGQRVVCWNAAAEVQQDFRLGFEARAAAYKGSPIEWAPDGKHWLLFGHHLLDRQTRRPVWKLKAGTHTDVPHRFADKDHLAVVRGSGDGGVFSVVRIPWTEIAQAAANQPSVISDQTPVTGPLSVKVEATNVVAGTAGKAAEELQNLVALRLVQLGLKVQSGQGDELRVTYSEEPPTRRVVPAPKRPGEPAAQGANREIHVVRIQLAFKFYRNGIESAWSQELSTEVESETGTFDEWTLRDAATAVLKGLRAPAWAEARQTVLFRLPLESSL